MKQAYLKKILSIVFLFFAAINASSEIEKKLEQYDDNTKKELKEKRNAFCNTDKTLKSKVNYFFPSAIELLKEIVNNNYQLTPIKFDNQWKIMHSTNYCDQISNEGIENICNHHYALTKIITDIIFENLKQYNNPEDNKEKIKPLIENIKNVIIIRKNVFLDDFFIRQNVQCNTPMLFHIAALENETKKYCFQMLINNHQETTNYYNMLKRFDYKPLLSQFKKNFLLCENYDYDLYAGPLKYIKIQKNNEDSIFQTITEKYHARKNIFDTLSEQFPKIFSGKLALILNNEYKNKNIKFDTQSILDENLNLSKNIIQQNLSKNTNSEDIDDIINYIQKKCVRLDSFIKIILLKNFKAESPHEQIITDKSYRHYVHQKKSVLIETESTELNRLYYQTAFFTAFEVLFNTTNNMNIDMYISIFKNMEEYFKKQNLSLPNFLYEYFQKNNTLFHQTTGNIFLTVLLFHKEFKPYGISFLDFFDYNNDQLIEINVEKQEKIFNNNGSNGKKLISQEKMKTIFQENSLKEIIQRLKISGPQRIFLSELFFHKSGYYEKIKSDEINIEEILNLFLSECKKESYPSFVNKAIESFITKKYFIKLLSSKHTFENNKTLRTAIFNQLSNIQGENQNLLKQIIKSQKLYNNIVAADHEMINGLDKIFFDQNKKQLKDQTSNQNQSKKNSKLKTTKTQTKKINKNTSFNYNKILIPAIILLIGGGLSLYYRAIISKKIQNLISKTKQQTIVN